MTVTEGASLRNRFDPAGLASSDPRSWGVYVDLVKAVLRLYTEPAADGEAAA